MILSTAAALALVSKNADTLTLEQNIVLIDARTVRWVQRPIIN